jgi:hypothetical protein
LFPPLSSIFPQLAKLGCFVSGFERSLMVFSSISVNLGGTVTIMLALNSLDRVAYASTGLSI